MESNLPPNITDALATLESEKPAIIEVDSIVIENESMRASATELMALARRVIREGEAKRKDLGEPFLRTKQAIDAAFKTALAPFVSANEILDKKLNVYLLAEEANARAIAVKAEIERQVLALAETKRLESLQPAVNEAVAAAFGVDIVEPVPTLPAFLTEPVVAVMPAHTIVGGFSTTAGRSDWDFEVVVPSAVPRLYCKPDEQEIRRAVKNGVRDIAGVKIFEVKKFNSRSR